MLQSKDELRALKETMRDDILLRVWGEHLDDLIDVQVSMRDPGGADRIHAFLDAMQGSMLDRVRVSGVDSLETQQENAVKIVEPDGRSSLYVNLDEEKIARIVQEHLGDLQVIPEYLDR